MGNAFTTQLLDLVEYTSYVATFADPARQIVEIDNYVYTIDGETLTAPITATASQSFLTQMQGENDFVLFGLSGFARTAASTSMIINPALLVQILDQTTGRTFFSAPAPMPMIAGSGGFPFLPTFPKVIRARSSLQTTAISAQVQSFTGFYLCLHGSRIWYG